MIPQYFRRGEPIDASKLNALVDGVLASRLQSGVGYTVANTSRGTSLNISLPSAGGASNAVCPFQVTTANEGDTWKFSIEFGLIAGKIPTGMFAGGVPALIMDWSDGWILAAVTFVTDQVTVDTVSFIVNADILANTEITAYYPIAYISTDSTGGTPTQVIQNLCATPTPSVCDLLFVPPSP
jgi:hypothetical protein